MTAPTHMAFGNVLMFCLAKMIGVSINPYTVSFCSFGACLPDIDTASSRLGRLIFPLARWIEGHVGHRTLVHSLLGWVGFGVVFLPLLFFVSWEVYAALMIGIISHNMIDMVNSTGVAFLWPNDCRWVFPYVRAHPTRYRVRTGSGVEFALLGVLVLFLAAFYPVGEFGFRRVLHVVLGNPQGAVYDYREMASRYKVIADVKGIDRITSKHFKGRYPVLGAQGNTTLIIKKEDGGLYTVGLRDDANFIPVSVRCKKSDRVMVLTQEVGMSSRTLQDIGYFLDPKKEQYLYGALKMAEDSRVPYNFKGFNTIFGFNGYLMFNLATWEDVKKADILGLYVVNGKMTVKTLLKDGETAKEIDTTMAEAKKYNLSSILVVSCKVDKPEEVLVKKGDRVTEGKILARTSMDAAEVIAKIRSKNVEKTRVMQLKSLSLAEINAKILTEEADLGKLREKERDLRELVSSQFVSQMDLQENLDRQARLLGVIRGLKNQCLQESEKYDIRLLELSRQLGEIERERDKLETDAVVKSKVRGMVTSVAFGASASKMPVTIKILTDVKTEGIISPEADKTAEDGHLSLSEGEGEEDGKLANRFQGVY